MKDTKSSRTGRDRVVLLLLFALFLFASPFTEWWASSNLPWHFPITLWALFIALLACNHIWGGRS